MMIGRLMDFFDQKKWVSCWHQVRAEQAERQRLKDLKCGGTITIAKSPWHHGLCIVMGATPSSLDGSFPWENSIWKWRIWSPWLGTNSKMLDLENLGYHFRQHMEQLNLIRVRFRPDLRYPTYAMPHWKVSVLGFRRRRGLRIQHIQNFWIVNSLDD